MNRVQLVFVSLLSLTLAACVTKSVGERLQPGAACAKGSDCASNLCLGQTCCSASTCGSDPTCQGSTCDATGACVYPAGACGSTACNTATHQLTTSACSQGACVAGTAVACPGHLTCADSASCHGSCSQTADCLSGFACSNSTCQPVVPAGGACISNDACTSGVCGATGIGHCCTTACLTGDSHGCGASDCDATGACVYPAATTSCVTQACLGHTFTEPATCNGQGSCSIPSPATADCAPYQCGPNATCATGCGDNAGCSVGFCHVSTHVCCPPYPGNQIEVDGTQGQDVGCCGGAGGTSACATIAYAVSLVGEIATSGITVQVSNAPNGTDWTADAFPIQLSYGLILAAPRLAFAGTPPTPVFLVQPFGQETTTSAVIEGSALQPIRIGIDSLGNVPARPRTVFVTSPMTLYLLDAVVHDSSVGNSPQDFDRCTDVAGSPYVGFTTCATGIAVMPGATLTLGTDGNGASGTVRIGDDDTGEQESVGIICYGLLDAGAQGIVNDTGSTAQPSVWIQHHQIGLAAVDGCSVHLSASPHFGPALDGQNQCPTRPLTDPFSFDGVGIYLNNSLGGSSSYTSTSVEVSNGLFQCCGAGVSFQPFGPESFTGDNDTIQYNTIGVFDGNGSFRVTGSTLSHNALGIQVAGGGVNIDLSDAGTQIICNGPSECGGMDMFSSIAVAGGVLVDLNVDSVNLRDVAWNHSTAGYTQLWTCTDTNASQCTCTGDATCPSGTGPLGAQADIISVGTASIDAAHAKVAPDGCP